MAGSCIIMAITFSKCVSWTIGIINYCKQARKIARCSRRDILTAGVPRVAPPLNRLKSVYPSCNPIPLLLGMLR